MSSKVARGGFIPSMSLEPGEHVLTAAEVQRLAHREPSGTAEPQEFGTDGPWPLREEA